MFAASLPDVTVRCLSSLLKINETTGISGATPTCVTYISRHDVMYPYVLICVSGIAHSGRSPSISQIGFDWGFE
jgi:hypothetical protein